MQVPEKKPIVELPTEQQVNEISDLLEDFDKKAYYILNGKKKGKL